MHIVLISTPIGFLGSGKGGGVELTLNSLLTGLIAKGHTVDVVAPKNSKLVESSKKVERSFAGFCFLNNEKFVVQKRIFNRNDFFYLSV